MQYGTTNNAGADQTSLTASTGFTGLVVVNSGSGGALFGQGSEFGVSGRSTSWRRRAVWAESTAGPCVFANTQTGGPAVRANIGATPTGPLNSNDSIEVTHQGTGAGMSVNHMGLGKGISVHLNDPANSSDAITVDTNGAGMGISAHTGSNVAVYGLNGGAAPLIVTETAAVKGESTGASGVIGTSDAAIGVRGVVGDVTGTIFNAGVVGEGNSSFHGVIGAAVDGNGVVATTTSGAGVATTSITGPALVATTAAATNTESGHPSAVERQGRGGPGHDHRCGDEPCDPGHIEQQQPGRQRSRQARPRERDIGARRGQRSGAEGERCVDVHPQRRRSHLGNEYGRRRQQVA